MRPRVFPAEDGGLMFFSTFHDGGFNEAAGIPRGRRNTELRIDDGGNSLQ